MDSLLLIATILASQLVALALCALAMSAGFLALSLLKPRSDRVRD